jgi:hypothetical protein
MPMVVLPFAISTPGGFVAPAGVTHVQLIGWGGGGGGGAGAGGGQRGYVTPGGGGGGGAQKDVTVVPVETGERYDIVIGPGGEGSPTIIDGVPVTGQHDDDGRDTQFVRSRDRQVLARFRGAGGGTSAWDSERPTLGRQPLTCGGSPIAGRGKRFEHSNERGEVPGPLPPGTGGYGISNKGPLWGLTPPSESVQGFVGGSHGPCGISEDIAEPPLYGGGGGGGGAAGPGGDGARGGGGGHAGRVDVEGFGEDGSSAEDGTGAGGGGGGTGGSLDRSGGSGPLPGLPVARPGRGGNGGSGHLTISYVA